MGMKCYFVEQCVIVSQDELIWSENRKWVWHILLWYDDQTAAFYSLLVLLVVSRGRKDPWIICWHVNASTTTKSNTKTTWLNCHCHCVQWCSNNNNSTDKHILLYGLKYGKRWTNESKEEGRLLVIYLQKVNYLQINQWI